jgi:single-strand DNA-binding protein
MNDTSITFRGYAGTDVRHRQVRDANVATVRVASTPRVRKDGEWVDGPTTWYAVTAWRTLADHLRDSVRKGDPLVVHGRLLRTETWAPEGGVPSTTLEVEAAVVGHDLNRGISHFIKAKRPESGAADAHVAGADAGEDGEDGADGAGGTDLEPSDQAERDDDGVAPHGRAHWAA